MREISVGHAILWNALYGTWMRRSFPPDLSVFFFCVHDAKHVEDVVVVVVVGFAVPNNIHTAIGAYTTSSHGDDGAIERGCTPFSISLSLSLSLWTVHIKGLVVTFLSRYQHHGTPTVAVPLSFSRRLSIFRGRSLSPLITLNSSSSARASDAPSIEDLIS